MGRFPTGVKPNVTMRLSYVHIAVTEDYTTVMGLVHGMICSKASLAGTSVIAQMNMKS